MKVLLLKGLPASGKTTYARSVVDSAPNAWVRVNKDDLRRMLNNDFWSKPNERYVNEIWEHIICTSLMQGKNVIVDDTNFNPRHERVVRATIDFVNQWAKDTMPDPITLEVKEFYVDVNECIKRDSERPNKVGEDVIRRMYERYYTKQLAA